VVEGAKRKICVVGLGTVGKATFKELDDLGHDVWGYDIQFHDEKTFKDKIQDIDTYFVCLPTDNNIESKQDLKAIYKTLNLIDIHRGSNRRHYVAIKSTILPKNLRTLIKSFEDIHIAYMPEFLSETLSYTERFPVVIGADEIYVLQYFGSLYPNAHSYFYLSPEEASFAKYMHNVLGAVKVTAFSHFFETAKENGYNYYKARRVLEAVGHTDKDYWQPARDGLMGFGGKCFPKDTKAWEQAFPSDLINGVLMQNHKWRKF